MKIHYKKKHQRINLILGCVWLVNGVIQVALPDNNQWYNYIWFLLSAMYFILYFYQNKNKYLSIEDGIIKENWFFGKSLVLKDIKVIKHFAGEYILKTKTDSLTIQIPLIENDSLLKLDERLRELDAEWK